MIQYKMFGFVRQIFVSAMMFVSSKVLKVNSLECISMSNQECKIRPETINININEPSFYPYSVKINKCSGSGNNINNPFTLLCPPDVVKNINVKVCNLMSRTNKTRHIKFHETCKCKCSVCNNQQRWNEDKWTCKCKELTDKDVFDKGFIWNLSNC